MNVRLITLVTLLVAIIGGFNAHAQVKILKKDEVKQLKKLPSVAFWRIEALMPVAEYAQTRSAFHLPIVELCAGGSTFCKDMRIRLKTDKHGRVMNGGWVERDGISYFNELMVVSLKPGKCKFKNGKVNDSGTANSTQYYNFALDRSTEIPDGSLVFLGVIQLYFDADGDPVAVFGDGDRDAELERFGKAFPNIRKHFGAHVASADWRRDIRKGFFYEGVSTGWVQSDYVVPSLFGCIGMLIEVTEDVCAWSYVDLPDDMPDKFSVTAWSSWREGARDQSHGVFLGTGSDEFFAFTTSADGAAGVSWLHDDKWSVNPVQWREGVVATSDGDTKHTHRIEVRDNEFSYAVDDSEVGSFSGQLDGQGWRIGLMVCGLQKVCFKHGVSVEEIRGK